MEKKLNCQTFVISKRLICLILIIKMNAFHLDVFNLLKLDGIDEAFNKPA